VSREGTGTLRWSTSVAEIFLIVFIRCLSDRRWLLRGSYSVRLGLLLQTTHRGSESIVTVIVVCGRVRLDIEAALGRSDGAIASTADKMPLVEESDFDRSSAEPSDCSTMRDRGGTQVIV
jgi:hypothetical protein